MSKRYQTPLADDLDGVMSFLKEKGVVPPHAPLAMMECAKRIHRATYSLILWRFRLKKLPEHGQVFVEEIASDALQILPQILMGYGKTAKLLTRGIIENTIRHIYFSDHPIEFIRMNMDRKWYVSIEDLFQYSLTHPIFSRTESMFDAISKLKTAYDDLSAGIHGRRVKDLEMRVSLKGITYQHDAVTAETLLVERCAGPVNFILSMFHRERLRRFEPSDRSIILRTMPPVARNVIGTVE